jgi:hypothetical protein
MPNEAAPSGGYPPAPTSTPDTTVAYFAVPEGELGQIVNALSTMAHASNPLDLLSLSGWHTLFDDTVKSIQQTLGLATLQTTAWTVLQVTSIQKIAAMKKAGYTEYSTRQEAQAQADNNNANVSPDTGGGFWSSMGGEIAQGFEQGVVSLLTDLWNTVKPFVYLIAGVIVLFIGIAYFFKNDIMSIARTASIGAAL